MEVVLRQVQRVEDVYAQFAEGHTTGKGGKGGRAQAKTQALGSSRVGYVMGEPAAFMGLARGRGAIMVCPELIECVAKEVERDAGILKRISKARAERALLTKKALGGGGGKRELRCHGFSEYLQPSARDWYHLPPWGPQCAAAPCGSSNHMP